MGLITTVITLPFKVVALPFKALAWLCEGGSTSSPDDYLRNRDFAAMRNQQAMRDVNNRGIQQMQRNAAASRQTMQQSIDYSRKQAEISRTYRNR